MRTLSNGLMHFITQKTSCGETRLLYLSFLLLVSTWGLYKWIAIKSTTHDKGFIDL